MPYKSNVELPTQLKSLPAEAQTIFRKAFNASFSKYGEVRARKIAWSAVKNVFEKNKEGKWVKKKKTQIKAFIYLNAQLQAFSQNEIIARIPSDVLEEIRIKDEHPFFQMYSICHEGVARPEIQGKGHTSIYWFKEAVKSIGKVIKKGFKFFNGHNKNINNPDKEELGEIIHAFEENIKGKLHYCTIGYFPPETREKAKTMDICSQEAEWNLIKAGGKLIADTCESFKGIALANSNFQPPAFKEAKRLAMVQAFENKSSGKDEEELMDLTTVKFDELASEVKRRHTLPSQLYSIDEIKKDREFADNFSELEKIKKDLEDKQKEFDDLKKSNDDLTRQTQLQAAKGKLSEIYKEKKLTDNIVKFIDDIYDENKEKIEDITDEGLKVFVKEQTKIFQKATGVAEKENNNIPSGDDIEADNKDNPFVDYNEEDY